MKRLWVLVLAYTLVLSLSGCNACVPTGKQDQSSNTQTQTENKPIESQFEEKENAADYLKKLGTISEVSARQKLWQAGYTPAEIKEAVEAAYPRTEAAKEESSKPEESSKSAEKSSKAEESSKAAEESKQESTETAESRTEESSSGNASSASSGSSETSTSSFGSGSASSGSSSSASSSSSQESQTQQEAESTTQESQSSSSGSSASSGSQDSQQQTQESAPAHVHTWVDVTEIVHHDAVTEQVWVVDEAVWDETVNLTETKEVTKCECRCGLVFDNASEWEAHLMSFDPQEGMTNHHSWSSVTVQEEVVVGTETIHHDEVGHYETKTVTEAYDEEVVVGQKCSECGATK